MVASFSSMRTFAAGASTSCSRSRLGLAWLAVFTATDYGTLPVVDVMPNLTLLPAGSLAIEPSALGSPAMRRLLDDASQRFDWIVIDSPPAVSVPEAGLLAGLVDAAILVIQADRTSQGEVTQALETIGHSRIIGAVLNRASKKAMAEEAASRLVS